jgi:hypothetical protein
MRRWQQVQYLLLLVPELLRLQVEQPRSSQPA